MTRRRRAPHGTITVLAVMSSVVAAGAASPLTSAATPPSTDPAAPDTPTTTEQPTGTYESGVFTAPDGSFTANFGDVPGRSVDDANGIVTYLYGVDEDSQSVVLFPPTALGATPESSAAERAELFLAASGSDIEYLANTSTNLGPFPASLFAARLTLADGRSATVYGVLADRGSDVAYAFYTDVGDDDNAVATAFVQSFSIALSEPPLPTTVPPTTVTAADPSASTTAAPSTTLATTTSVVAPTTSAAPTSITQPPPSTVVEAPDGALLGFDGRWWVTFPSGAAPSFRASIDSGFAYAEYLAIDGDDTLIVRVTEVPAGYEWNAELVPDAAADRVGGSVLESDVVELSGRPAVRFSFAQDDSDSSGDGVEALVVNGGDQIYAVEFWDGGVTSTDAATEFIDSFGLA
jgi:hypothetical protein